MTEDEMAGWYHRLDGCKFEWTPGVGDRQGGLVFCDSRSRKESDTTEQLNWIELNRSGLIPKSLPYQLWDLGHSIMGSHRVGHDWSDSAAAAAMAQPGRNQPAMRETWVWSPGWEDPLEKAWQQTRVFLPGVFPWTEEPGRISLTLSFLISKMRKRSFTQPWYCSD